MIKLTARGENLVVTTRLSNSDIEKNEEESQGQLERNFH